MELLDACRVNDLSTVKSMLEKDLTLLLKRDSNNNTVYHISASNGHLEILKHILTIDKGYKNSINYLNYEQAIDETKKALNEFNTFIYSIYSTKYSYNKLKNSRTILHSLLNKHISDMATLFKNENKSDSINIDKKPDCFYDMYFKIDDNNTSSKDYISVYNVY